MFNKTLLRTLPLNKMSPIVENNRTLPAATTNGSNTFGCLVNDSLFLTNPIPGQQKSVYGEFQYYNQIKGINIYADDFTANRSLVIFFYNPDSLVIGKEYDLTSPEFFIQYIDFNKPPACTYRSMVKGHIMITRFTVSASERIISGTFSFTAESDECDEEVTISEGRFDVSDISE